MIATYDPACCDVLHAADPRHFWFRARNRVIETVVRQTVAGLAPGYRVLDAGCGTGGVLPALESACREGRVIGLDRLGEGLRYARQRSGCALVQGDTSQPPFGQPFAVVGLFDVLEHLPDDVEALRTLHPLVAPGGALILTVPAGPELWSYADDAACHQRRYTRDSLARAVERAGYRIEYLTPYMASLVPFLWLGRTLIARGHGSARQRVARELRVIPVINDVMAAVLLTEARWVARRRMLPMGTSLVAVARRS